MHHPSPLSFAEAFLQKTLRFSFMSSTCTVVLSSGKRLNTLHIASCMTIRYRRTDHLDPANVAVTVIMVYVTSFSKRNLLACATYPHATLRTRCGKPTCIAQCQTTLNCTFSKAVAQSTTRVAVPLSPPSCSWIPILTKTSILQSQPRLTNLDQATKVTLWVLLYSSTMGSSAISLARRTLLNQKRTASC